MLSRDQILGAMHSTLTSSGYSNVSNLDSDLIHGGIEDPLRVYESEYSVVAIALYTSWPSLADL